MDVSLHDFGIHAAVAQASGPAIVFDVHNDAPATHEFVVVRTDDRRRPAADRRRTASAWMRTP